MSRILMIGVLIGVFCFPVLGFAQNHKQEIVEQVVKPCYRAEARISGLNERYGEKKAFSMVKKARKGGYAGIVSSLSNRVRNHDVDMREAVYGMLRAECEQVIRKKYNKLKSSKQISMKKLKREVRKYVLDACYYQYALGEGYLKRMSKEKALRKAEKVDRENSESLYDSIYRGMQSKAIRGRSAESRKSIYRYFRELCRKTARETASQMR